MYLGFERFLAHLNIFRRREANRVLYYAPGYVACVSKAGQATFEDAIAHANGHPPEHPAVLLVQHASRAQAKWAEMFGKPYQPACLTIYPTNQCNLDCAYCYSVPHNTLTAQGVGIDTIRDAAHIVAANCRALNLPFTLVIHGGGEPTVDQPGLESILSTVEETARLYRLKVFKYIATNGVMPRSRARWISQSFDLIGLSCDGPEEIQAAQRPMRNGKSSSLIVERTADVLHQACAAFNVRVTVTRQTIERQAEIVDYICERLRPGEIHIESIYQGGRASADCTAGAPLAETFFEHFRSARARGRQKGIRVLFTGARPGEIHGPYCQVLRGVLNLVPGDVATACFKSCDADQAARLRSIVGSTGEEGFRIDYRKVLELRRELEPMPQHCQECFNQFHCARACPDGCALEPGNSAPWNEFRCQLQMLLAANIIEQAASELCPNSPDQPAGQRLKAGAA